MRHYETIHTEDTRGFHVIFSVTTEDFHPRDCFDETVEDISEICSKIDAGLLSWFCARVEVYQQGILLGTDYLGGCLYESPMHFVKESGYYDDMITEAITHAENNLEKLFALRNEVT